MGSCARRVEGERELNAIRINREAVMPSSPTLPLRLRWVNRNDDLGNPVRVAAALFSQRVES